jgi:hypothetical protein
MERKQKYEQSPTSALTDGRFAASLDVSNTLGCSYERAYTADASLASKDGPTVPSDYEASFCNVPYNGR